MNLKFTKSFFEKKNNVKNRFFFCGRNIKKQAEVGVEKVAQRMKEIAAGKEKEGTRRNMQI